MGGLPSILRIRFGWSSPTTNSAFHVETLKVLLNETIKKIGEA